MSRLLTLIVGVLLVGGCSAPGLSVPSDSPSGTTTSSAPALADPIAISIPSIDARSSLIPLGLDEDGQLAVPPVTQPGQAAWYAGAKPDVGGDEFQPGENGPAVISGHVDGTGPDGQKGFPGIFARLDELQPGDEVFIDQSDGGQLRFLVDRVERHAKADFPTEAVYGPTRGPELRLITCGGAFDRAAGHYTDNVVVFASLDQQQP